MMNRPHYSMEKILWKDSLRETIIASGFFFGVAALMAWIFFDDAKTHGTSNVFMVVIMIGLPLLLAVPSLYARRTFITRAGISMGRTFTKAPSGQRQEVRFVRWSDIISLRIHGRIVGGGNHAQMQDFLDVKTRQNETLSCLLHAPDIFVEAVKAAGHGGLLDAKSKYLKGWDAEYADEFDDEKIDIDAKGFLHFWAYCGGSILAAVLIMHVAIAPFTHRALIIWLAIAFVPGILALVWFLAKKNARSKK